MSVGSFLAGLVVGLFLGACCGVLFMAAAISRQRQK